MAKKAPGKHFRDSISLVDLFKMFPDDKTAEAWFIKQFWPNGICCIRCGSVNIQTGAKHKSMPFRCRDCRKRFSTRTDTVMHSSKLGYQVWAIAIYLLTTSLKSVSSMKLHRDLNVTQKTAWHLAHRIRESMTQQGQDLFKGPVEVDETYVGGLRKNMPKSKRQGLEGRGPAGKVAVVGIKDRDTNEVRTQVVNHTDAETLHGFIAEHTEPFAKVYTDDAKAYSNLPYDHESVKHSVAEYVRGQAHTNGVESFWSTLKRAHKGTFHRLSHKHLPRYVTEFTDKHNVRTMNTLSQMVFIAKRMGGRKLRYKDLVA